MRGNSSRLSSPWNLPLIAHISCQENFFYSRCLIAFLRIFLLDFVSSLDPHQVCVDVRQTVFSFGTCAIVKSVEGLVYLLEPCSFGSLLSHSFFYDLFS
jgi:hypothetical protein